jgi:hypothetical protein
MTATQAEGFIVFTITSITVSGTPGPTSYVDIISRDLSAIVTSALDNLVIERFTTMANIQSITINGDTMTLSTLP